MKFLPIFLGALLLAGCQQESPRSDSDHAMNQPAAPASAVFQCPMHPQFTSDNPDASCSICGMNLVPAKSDSRQTTDKASISVDGGMLQSMGVRTATAVETTLNEVLRAFGSVEANERQENVTVSRLEGWIDTLDVRAEGDTVNQGTLLYRVYSPDLIAAQKDYLNSLTIGNAKRIAAVRQRLRSLGMQERVIEQLTRSGQVVEKVPVYAEAGGIVAELTVREGEYVKPGTPIMRLQSYRDVWVIASIPEQDLAQMVTGLEASLSFPSAPRAEVTGTVDYVYPTIDTATRTGKVRIEVDNSQGYLRPGAYADIQFKLAKLQRLSIPTEAVLRDSRGHHVITALGEGRFASQAVRVGVSNGERTEILAGLSAGDKIVVSGQFMLDSEVNLREGLSKLSPSGEADPDNASDDPHSGHHH